MPLATSEAVTWLALLLEAALPIALWVRATRRPAIVAGMTFHCHQPRVESLGIRVSDGRILCCVS